MLKSYLSSHIFFFLGFIQALKTRYCAWEMFSAYDVKCGKVG